MIARRLHLLMSISRPAFAARLVPYYLERMEEHNWEVRWHWLVQGPEPDSKGIRKISEAMDYVPWKAEVETAGQPKGWTPNADGRCGTHWIGMLSDDSWHHPSLFRRLEEIIDQNPGCQAVVFDEYRGKPLLVNGAPTRVLRAGPENMRECRVDGGQVWVRRDLVGTTRFDLENRREVADGTFVCELYGKAPEGFVFVNEALVCFGTLEWSEREEREYWEFVSRERTQGEQRLGTVPPGRD